MVGGYSDSGCRQVRAAAHHALAKMSLLSLSLSADFFMSMNGSFVALFRQPSPWFGREPHRRVLESIKR
jgi:hypothetical protein